MNSIQKTLVSSLTAVLAIAATAQSTHAPSFSETASNGKTYTLQSLSGGKPLLLMFFSAGCPHNVHGVKDLNRLQVLFGNKVRVAGMVNLDPRQTKLLADHDHAKFPILSDQMATTIKGFGGAAGLDNALILPNGDVAHLWRGYDQVTLKQIEILLKRNHGPDLKLDLSSFPKSRQAGCSIGMSM